MDDVVYFELNNWFAGRDYPNAEPFLTWCGDDSDLYFLNEDFVKKNKLCVVAQCVDMSVNWCITLKKSFVLENCPKLLSDEATKATFILQKSETDSEIEEKEFPYRNFLRFPGIDGYIYGRFGAEFLQWSEENIGIHYLEDEL